MPSLSHFMRRAAACVLFFLAGSVGAQNIDSKYAEANGVRLHDRVAGKGAPVILLHGKLVDTNVEGVVVKGSGHSLMEKAPGVVIPKPVDFLKR